MSERDISIGLAGAAPAPWDDDAEELYEEAPCGYLSTAPDGTIRRANRTFLSWSGYAVGELVGRRFYDLLPPGAKIYYETHYAPLLQMQGSVRELAFELNRADGSRLPVLVNAALKRDPAGRPLVVRITVFDATDRRRYERELLLARVEAEERAAAASALAHVSEGVVLVDADGRVRLLNPAAERIFRVSHREALGLPATALSEDWDRVHARIPVNSSDGLPVAATIVPLVLAGDTRWLAASAESAPEGVVYTVRDVTEQRRLEELRDDIVSIVSHELRTPLTGVYGAAQTLSSLGDRLGEGERRQLIELIAEQSGRLTRIVEEILLTKRLDTGDIAFDRRAFDVGEALEGITAGVRAWRTSRPIVLRLASGVEAEGDPAMFEQAVTNLLDNAVKYSPPDTEIRITLERLHGHARVTVADAGPGIPPAEHDRIFEKFFRLDPAQASGVAGTGLGLYVARELARRMHGRLGLVPSDRGSIFFLDLPLHHPAGGVS